MFFLLVSSALFDSFRNTQCVCSSLDLSYFLATINVIVRILVSIQVQSSIPAINSPSSSLIKLKINLLRNGFRIKTFLILIFLGTLIILCCWLKEDLRAHVPTLRVSTLYQPS